MGRGFCITHSVGIQLHRLAGTEWLTALLVWSAVFEVENWRSMVSSCVAAGSNQTCKDGVSLFTFPKNTQLRKRWVDQVKRTRDKWEHS